MHPRSIAVCTVAVMLTLVAACSSGGDSKSSSSATTTSKAAAGSGRTTDLKLDPKHTGALEYQGILFLKLGQLDKAKANLAKIKTISGATSEEYKDLAKAIGG